MEKHEIQVGVVGDKARGQDLARQFYALGALAAVCDSAKPPQESAAKQHAEVPIFAEFPALLAFPSLTAVAIATPAETHAMLVRQALLAGLDVFVDVPLCLSPVHEHELVDLAHQQNRVLMVGQPFRYQTAVQKLKSLFGEPALGRMGEMAGRISAWLDPFKAERLHEECQHFLDRCKDRRAPRREITPVRAWKAHESAFIDDGVDIGAGTQIWHVSHIIKGSKIGKNCRIGQNVVIGPNVTVGDGVKIQNNVSVYDGVTLEDGVFCGPSMVFTNVFNPRSEITRKDEYKKTLVKRGASIGANATIVCGTTVGRYAFVAAGAVVSKDVPDFGLVMGVPARRTGWVCQCGVKLSFSDNDALCAACGATYRKNGDTILRQGI